MKRIGSEVKTLSLAMFALAAVLFSANPCHASQDAADAVYDASTEAPQDAPEASQYASVDIMQWSDGS